MPPPVDLAELQRRIAEEPALMVWVSGPDCGVCHALRPKIESLLDAEFPRIAKLHIDAAAAPEIAAQLRIFSIPAALFFFDGREAVRFVRNFGPAQVRDALDRPYGLFFG